jgi:hypothetical protein
MALNVGDTVELTQNTMMDRAGARGVIVRKYTPAHCTGVWSLTVQLDGNEHLTSYPYPTLGLLRKVELADLINAAQRKGD